MKKKKNSRKNGDSDVGEGRNEGDRWAVSHWQDDNSKDDRPTKI